MQFISVYTVPQSSLWRDVGDLTSLLLSSLLTSSSMQSYRTLSFLVNLIIDLRGKYFIRLYRLKGSHYVNFHSVCVMTSGWSAKEAM